MQQYYLIIFEAIMLILLYFCIQHAWRHERWPAIWALFAGVIFGWLLEWVTIKQLSAYEYGDFFLKIGPLPLSIGIGWGVIIYSAMLFSNASSLPEWARPLLDALLALNIDLAMDAIAIRLGMWDWGQALDFNYFGVPYANFWAWFWVVFSFSASLRLLTNLPRWAGRWLAPLGAILLGTLVVLGTNALIVFVLRPIGLYEASNAIVLFGGLAMVAALNPKFNICPVDPVAFWVPFAFHSYFLVAGLISGALFQPPLLLAPGLLMFIVAAYLHRKTFSIQLIKG
jgi:hypothetical protein